MPWVIPNWDKEFEEFETMEFYDVVDNAVKAFNVARTQGKPVRLNLNDPRWRMMENTTSGRDLTLSQVKVETVANGHNVNTVDGIYETICTNGNVEVPIIMVHPDGTYRKVAGNHRLMVSRAMRLNPIVWLFEYPKCRHSEENDEPVRAIIREMFGSNSVQPVLNSAIVLPVEVPQYDKSLIVGDDENAIELPMGQSSVTLINSATIKPILKILEKTWPEILKNLPQAPEPQFSTEPKVARRENGKVTWFLPVTNQEQLKSYVECIDNAIREYSPKFEGGDGVNFFHLVIANNRSGNPNESINDIEKDDLGGEEKARQPSIVNKI